MSVVDALKFLFSDADWTHDLLIGSVFMFIPVVGPLALMGWHAEMVQRLVRRHPRPIPRLDFSDLTHYLSRGVYPFVVQLVMSLPISLVATAVAFGAFFLGAAGAATLKDPTVLIIAGVAAGALVCLFVVVVSVFMFGAMTHAEITEDIGRSLSPNTILEYAGKTWWKVVVASFLFFLLAFPIGIVGYAMCIIGFYPASIIISTGISHLRWQVYCRYLWQGGTAIAVKAPVAIPSEASAAVGYPGYVPR